MSRPERLPLKLLRPSDPAAPEFGWEKFHAIAHELPVLFKQHWQELALNKDVVPLDPNWDEYYQLDISGVLQVLTARVPGGQLVGYVFLLVGPNRHYKSTRWGHAEMYWLDPVYRQGWTGVRFMKAMVTGARTLGVVNLTLATKLHFADNRVTKLLQRLGFVPIETIHAMRLI
jgi:GNAT superfamily N-acetyltransferase